MRLIDAHGSYTINANDNTAYSLAFGGGIISVADDFGHILAEFDADDAPTVEAEPVRHGRWEENDDYDASVCSSCQTMWNNLDNDTQRFNYCPNCGAKMDGGNDHAKE